MSHITKIISLDSVEYFRAGQKFRYLSRCLSGLRKSEIVSGQTYRPLGYHQQQRSICQATGAQHRQPRSLPSRMQPVLLFRQPARCYSDSLPPHQTIALPALSPTMESGAIVSWEKQAGDEVTEGDVLCEVETDKATMGLEATEPGFIAKVLVPAGTKGLALGTPLCIVVATKAEVAAFADYTPSGGDAASPASSPAYSSSSSSSSTSAASQKEAGSSAASSSDLPHHLAITLPALSPTMELGTIVSWEKKEGDYIKEGDLLAEIETDKATMGFEASEEGYLARIFVPAGSKGIPLGSVLCVLVDSEADVAKFASVTAAEIGGGGGGGSSPSSQSQSKPQPTKTTTTAPTPAPAAASSTPASSGDRVRASPYARLLARERGVSLAAVTTASGADGRIVSADVLGAATAAPAAAAAAKKSKAAPAAGAAAADYVDLPLSNMRATIAKRLTQSKQSIPHYYLTVQITMDQVMKVRQTLNKQLAGRSVKLSVNDFVIKAAAVALGRVPECNSAWHDGFIRQFNRADVSVAVATDNGLITPIVFSADAKGLVGINADVARLAERARANKLQPQEFQGGTFTISNLGMFGIQSFSAIINPPQACILAVGGAQKVLVPGPADPDTGKDSYSTSTVMHATLCCDHRVVDGAVGARWLSEFKACLENPFNMLL